jgi:hypothetical protein
MKIFCSKNFYFLRAFVSAQMFDSRFEFTFCLLLSMMQKNGRRDKKEVGKKENRRVEEDG